MDEYLSPNEEDMSIDDQKWLFKMQSWRCKCKSKSKMETWQYILYFLHEKLNWDTKTHSILWLFVRIMTSSTMGTWRSKYMSQDNSEKTSTIGYQKFRLCLIGPCELRSISHVLLFTAIDQIYIKGSIFLYRRNLKQVCTK